MVAFVSSLGIDCIDEMFKGLGWRLKVILKSSISGQPAARLLSRGMFLKKNPVVDISE